MSAGSDPAIVMQQLMQAGQAASHWFSTQQKQIGEGESPLVRVQHEWLERHAQLWRAMLLMRQQPQTPGATELPQPADRRFSDIAWSESPVYDYLRRAYLINAEFVHKAVDELPLADDKYRSRLRFLAKQYVDALCPANFAATNPEFIKTAVESNGASIQRGILNLLSDLQKGHISTTDEDAFEVGRNVAMTPGAVVFENELFQLLQYSPSTERVYQRPLLIVPPCINKYYILDLRPENSFVRFAVSQGHTVFLMSWRNVKPEQGHLTWDDYIEHGILAAIRVVRDVSRARQINALGFCVGGTLLGSALAVARARGGDPVKSLTLLTSLLDFSEAGELSCLVDEASLAAREQAIGKGGIFPGREFASVFSALRPNDLIWNYVVNGYLNGEKPPAFDLLFWNSDSTNLPGPFLVWYLRNMYLDNNLCVPGRLEMCGARVNLASLRMPAFVLATREDHIVPWQGAFRSMQCLGGETTFVLGAAGHIAGVINPADSGKRSYWTGAATSSSPADWFASARESRGSWWPMWSRWLQGFGGKRILAAARLGNDNYPPIEPAPGRYVKEKA